MKMTDTQQKDYDLFKEVTAKAESKGWRFSPSEDRNGIAVPGAWLNDETDDLVWEDNWKELIEKIKD